MTTSFRMTDRDREILRALTLFVRLFSQAQIAEYWFENDKANARRRLRQLAECDLVARITVTAYLFEKNGRYRVLNVSEDFPQGEPVPMVEASDIEDLAKLTAGIAGVLHNHAQLEPGLSDDLGCLAHTLSNALGVQFQQNYIPIGEVQ